MGGLCANGYFVCVGCVEKYDGDWEGRCLCARPCRPVRAHPSLNSLAHNAYIFLYGNAAARTFGRARRHRPYAFCLRELRTDVRPYGFVWVDCAWVVWFVCWENGTHEPTPSVLYFCQPRVDFAALNQPWVKSWRGTYAIGIVLFKTNFRAGNHLFATCGDDV